MRFLIIVLLVSSAVVAQGQLVGGRIGYGIHNFVGDTITVQNTAGNDTLRLWLDDAGGTNSFGIFFRVPVTDFGFLDIEPMLSTTAIPIRVQNPTDWNNGVLTKRERLTTFDLSLYGGLRIFETIRLQAGITGQYVLRVRSEMEAFSPEYQNDWQQILRSYQFGAGIDLERLTIDVNWERPFGGGLGDDITFFGNSYSFNAPRERLNIKLGFKMSGSM